MKTNIVMNNIRELEKSIKLANRAAARLNLIVEEQWQLIKVLAHEIASLRSKAGNQTKFDDVLNEYGVGVQKYDGLTRNI